MVLISSGIAHCARHMVRISCFGLMAVCLGLVAPSPLLSLAWGGVPCVDVDDDGVCDSGDITAEILDDGHFSTPHSILIPSGASLVVNDGSLSLSAGGKISLGSKATLKAGLDVALTAGGDIVLGPRASVLARKDRFGSVFLTSENGNISLENDSQVVAKYGVSVEVWAGELTASGARVYSLTNYVDAFAGENVTVNGSSIRAPSILTVQSGGTLVDFSGNKVALAADGMVLLSAFGGSTVNVCGTVFKRVDPANVIIDPAPAPCD